MPELSTFVEIAAIFWSLTPPRGRRATDSTRRACLETRLRQRLALRSLYGQQVELCQRGFAPTVLDMQINQLASHTQGVAVNLERFLQDFQRVIVMSLQLQREAQADSGDVTRP